MKTRIISGIIMGVIVAAVLALGYFVSPVIVTIAIAAISVVAVYELLHNAAGITNKACLAGAGAFSALNVIARDYYVQGFLYGEFSDVGTTKDPMQGLSSLFNPQTEWFSNYKSTVIPLLAVIFFIFAVVMILKNHKDFGLPRIVTFCAMPIVLSYAFSTLNSIISEYGIIYYLLMLLNFSSICDMGAYFVGVTCGKHKLCPEISPKKTVEGAVGGIVTAVIVMIAACLIFGAVTGDTANILLIALLTPILSFAGMMGDLVASYIKRASGIKDYGNIMPGHGGVLDRFDSVMMIAPIMYVLLSFCQFVI